MLDFLFKLFKRKPQQNQAFAPAEKQIAAKIQAAEKNQESEILLDDSELGSNVNFDDRPLTSEQMKKVDIAV